MSVPARCGGLEGSVEDAALPGGFEGDDWWVSGGVVAAPRASSAPNGSSPAARLTPNTQTAITPSRAAMAIRRRRTKEDRFFMEEEMTVALRRTLCRGWLDDLLPGTMRTPFDLDPSTSAMGPRGVAR